MINKSFFVPFIFRLIILKNIQYFLLLNFKNDFIVFKILNYIKFCKETNTISYNDKINFVSKLVIYLESFSTINIKTIKFKGKGYKLTKKNNCINFMFNFSHLNYVIAKNTIIKKLNKNKIIIINYNNNKLIGVTNDIINIRHINSYTSNGLRNKRQFIIKRKGKTLTN